jgi:hypothetical protein
MKEILNEWRQFLNEKKQPPKNIIPKGFVEYETKEGDTIQSLIDNQNLPYGTKTPQQKWNWNNIQFEIRMKHGRANPGTDITQLEIPVGTKVLVPFTSGLARVTPADKLVRRVKDFDPAKDMDTFINNLSKQARKIPFGFTHSGQPTMTRATNRRGQSTELVRLGPAKIDKVLAWLINNMRFHASLLGIIDDDSRYFMPSGPNSGFRTDDIQKKKFIRKFNELNDKLKNGATSVSKKGAVLKIKDGKFFVNGKEYKNLANAIHLVARKEIARPKERITLTAFNGDSYKIYPGDPKHGTGRTVDFVLQGDDGSLNMDKNDAARSSNTGLFLNAYAPMYGLVNYGNESWHWELNKANRDFFAKMMASKKTPLRNAIESLPTVKPAE